MPTTPDEAVRKYLDHLNGSGEATEDNAAAELRQRLEAAQDPIERLQLRTELAQATDPARFEEAFVTHAKAWADHNGVTAEAFVAEGVPPEVLRRAGLLPRRGQGGGRRRAAPRARVTTEQIREAVPRRGRKFTANDLQEASGASAATVRKALAEMLANGELEDLGPEPNHTGPGRAPLVYKKARGK